MKETQRSCSTTNGCLHQALVLSGSCVCNELVGISEANSAICADKHHMHWTLGSINTRLGDLMFIVLWT